MLTKARERGTLHEMPETKYARSAGLHIAYQVVGEGPLDLVFANSWLSHVEASWENPTIERFYEQLASCDIHIATGTGQWENSGPSYRLSEILAGKGIRHSLDNWGPDGGHDWPYWKHMMREYIYRLF